MPSLWLNAGQLVEDESGNLVECNDCPCVFECINCTNTPSPASPGNTACYWTVTSGSWRIQPGFIEGTAGDIIETGTVPAGDDGLKVEVDFDHAVGTPHEISLQIIRDDVTLFEIREQVLNTTSIASVFNDIRYYINGVLMGTGGDVVMDKIMICYNDDYVVFAYHSGVSWGIVEFDNSADGYSRNDLVRIEVLGGTVKINEALVRPFEMPASPAADFECESCFDHRCCFEGAQPKQITVEIDGIRDETCPDCDDLNGTYVLKPVYSADARPDTTSPFYDGTAVCQWGVIIAQDLPSPACTGLSGDFAVVLEMQGDRRQNLPTVIKIFGCYTNFAIRRFEFNTDHTTDDCATELDANPTFTAVNPLTTCDHDTSGTFTITDVQT